jgi:hypothetical protein
VTSCLPRLAWVMVSLNRSRDRYKYLIHAGFLAVAVLGGSLTGLDG